MLSLVLALAAPAFAQGPAGTVEGSVVDDMNVGYAGVTITATNRASGVRRVTVTDGEGRYRIEALPVEGEYDLQAALAGLSPAVRRGVTLIAGEVVVVNFVPNFQAAEIVAVTATEPSIDRGRSTVQQSFGERLVHAVPLVNRNFLTIASLAAGFTGNPNFPSPQGQVYWNSNFLVDGASHFSKWRSAARAFDSGYGLESIREVQVLTNRFSAEYGEALASITSAVTRSGANGWHGSALLFLQDDALNSVPAFATRKAPTSSQQYGFTLGGPIRSDESHIFANYEARRTRNRNIVVSPAAPGAMVADNQDEQFVFLKVDRQRSPRHAMSGRYNGQRFRWHDEPGGLTLPGGGTSYVNDAQTVLATDAFQASSRLGNELRVQFARFVDLRRDLQPTVFVSRAGYSLQGGTFGSQGFGADPEDTWEAADTLSYWVGTHTLRFGAGLKAVRAHTTSLNYGQGAYFFAGDPAQFPQPFLFVQNLPHTPAEAIADPRSLSSDGFVQDDWRVRTDLTLNLGLRYDIEQVSNVRGYAVPVDTNNIQPRAGAAWEPAALRGTVVRGGAGLYNQQSLLYYISRVQLEGLDGPTSVTLSPDSPLMPVFPNVLPAFASGVVLPPRDIQRVGSTFANAYSIQATAGVQRTLFGTQVSADYVYLRGLDLMSLVDVNPPASNQKPQQRSVAQADATRPIVPAPGGYRKIVTLGNVGRSWYRALQVKGVRTTGQLQTVAAYTWARAEDLNRYQLPEDSRDLAAERARSAADVRHSMATAFTWDMPGTGRLLRDWSVSGVGIFRSNRPYDITWGDDRNGTTQNDARPGARNTGKTDAYANVDVGLARRFRLGPRILETRVEAFNVFNTTNYDEFVGALASPLFGRPVSAFPGRRVQVAAILRF